MLARNEILQNRYRIIRQLGYGGMGAVYEATDERFGSSVALKQIAVESSATENQKESFVRAFEREARTLAKARHEAIPFVRDYFSELDSQFLVMELVEGEDLAEMLEKRRESFPLEDVLNWADQLLDALDYLHNLTPPIFHRDIKPQNLKLNSRQKIKLLDFGIAKIMDNAASTVSEPTFVGATVNYSPIEQILRVIDGTFREFILLKYKTEAETILAQNTDARCDIYSLGATFYQLLTNLPPTDAIKRAVALWSGEIDPLPNPSEINRTIPPAISACLLKALAVERDQRFSSAIEMRQALSAAILEASHPERAADNNLRLEAEKRRLLEAEEEEKRRQEQLLMGARTERLISTDEQIKAGEVEEKKPEEVSDDSFLPTEPLDKWHPGSPSAGGFGKTASSLKAFSDTRPSGSISKSELQPEPPFPDDLSVDQKENKPEPEDQKEPVDSRRGNKMLFWILPVVAVALGILAVGGIGGMLWLNNSNSNNQNKEIQIPVDSPTVSATPTPTATPTATATATATASPLQNNSAVNNETPKPPVTPTVEKTPTRTPTKTPTRTPTRTPTPKTSDANCVYTNSCQ